MFTNVGIKNTTGIVVGMVAAFSVFPTIGLHLVGRKKHAAARAARHA